MESTGSSKRIAGKWAPAFRLAWLLILALAVINHAAGLPLVYAEMNEVCTARDEVCLEGISLSPAQVELLEAYGISLRAFAGAGLAWRIFVTLSWMGIGVAIFLLRPNESMAWIASAMMILFGTGYNETQIAAVYPALGGVASFSFSLSNILLFLFIALFPNGRFSPRWTRWYWYPLLLAVLVGLDHLIGSDWITVLWVSVLGMGSYTQIRKYRYESGPVERRQTKWVVAGFAGMAGLIFVYFLAYTIFLSPGIQQLVGRFVFDGATLLLPVSIGFSVLRYRLWDIDVLIRRTLQYSVLTGLLALAYSGGIVVLQGVFGGLTGNTNSPLITVLTTLLIAALFTPLRNRVQRFIDRRFYRGRYVADQVLDRFAATARDEVDMDRLTTALVGAVEEAMRPEKVGLWLRPAKRG